MRNFEVRINNKRHGYYEDCDWEIFKNSAFRTLEIYPMGDTGVARVDQPSEVISLGSNDTLMIVYG
jgi:hypothetical protein